MAAGIANYVWVRFVVAPSEMVLKPFLKGVGTVTHYTIRQVVPVQGMAHNLPRGWSVVRLDSPRPPRPGVRGPKNVQVKQFYGVEQPSHYTSNQHRELLDRISLPELTASENTIGVLIPIHKSEKWWRLAQDQRQAYFDKTESWEGHTAIGLKFADRIFRRLYHSRYLGMQLDYDFLTYFEFEEKYQRDFRALLSQLRDTKLNPEWKFVDEEFEVWMTKIR